MQSTISAFECISGLPTVQVGHLPLSCSGSSGDNSRDTTLVTSYSN